MPCPLCKELFTIPVEGLSAMPKARETSDALHRLVASDTEKVTNLLTITEEVLQRLKKEQNDVMKHLDGIDDEINSAADRLIAVIQSDRAKLWSKVALIRLKREQLDTVRQKVKQHAMELVSFKSQSEKFLSSGTACKANSLHDRADELMKFDVIGHVDSCLPPTRVNFISSTLMDRKHENLVGNITEGQLNQCSNRTDEKWTNLVQPVQLVYFICNLLDLHNIVHICI